MKLFLILISLTAFLSASQAVATLVQLEGKVKVLSYESIKKHTAKAEEKLFAGDKLMTYANSKVLVVLEDASTIVMNANAELEFDDDSHIKQASGEAYYQIVKRPKQKGLHVTTPFSIIGIKGTEFIVNFDHDGQVALNEGIVSISSTDEEAKFELYQQQELSDFEKYKAEQKSGFKAYKKRLEDAIVSYVNSFDLQSHKMLTFKKAETCKEACSKQVLEEDFTQEVNAKFKEYQRLMSQWK